MAGAETSKVQFSVGDDPLFSRHLVAVRALLHANVEHVTIQIAEHIQAFQMEVMRRAQAEQAGVCVDNEQYGMQDCFVRPFVPGILDVDCIPNGGGRPQTAQSDASIVTLGSTSPRTIPQPSLSSSSGNLQVPNDNDNYESARGSSNCGLRRAGQASLSDYGDCLDKKSRKSKTEVMELQAPKAKHGAVFADASAMKEKIRAAVCKKEYKVADFYHNTGCCQRLARNQRFENITLAIIAFNSLWIAIDTDLNQDELLIDAHPVFQVAEHGFCAFFTFECFVRFGSFKHKRDALRDGWFNFDTALVILMITETWIMTSVFVLMSGGSKVSAGNTSVLKLVRLVRLTRMARMARLLRALPELIVLIKGMWVASRSVFFTLCLLVIIMYLFAIIFRQITPELADDNYLVDKYFDNVPKAMFSLLLEGVLPDMAPIISDCADEHPVLGVLILLFVLLASLTVMNMLIGVLCEVVSVVSSVEKEQMTVSYVKSELLAMFECLDGDDNKSISQKEFESLLVIPEAAKIIQNMGVDVVGLVDFADYIFTDDKQLSFAEFMELVLQLRGSNNSTVKDIVDLRRLIMSQLQEVGQTVKECTAKMELEMRCKVDKVLTLSRKQADKVTSPPSSDCRSRSPGVHVYTWNGGRPNHQRPHGWIANSRPMTVNAPARIRPCSPPLPAFSARLYAEDDVDDDTTEWLPKS